MFLSPFVSLSLPLSPPLSFPPSLKRMKKNIKKSKSLRHVAIPLSACSRCILSHFSIEHHATLKPSRLQAVDSGGPWNWQWYSAETTVPIGSGSRGQWWHPPKPRGSSTSVWPPAEACARQTHRNSAKMVTGWICLWTHARPHLRTPRNI